jgi:hypothetical protein
VKKKKKKNNKTTNYCRCSQWESRVLCSFDHFLSIYDLYTIYDMHTNALRSELDIWSGGRHCCLLLYVCICLLWWWLSIWLSMIVNHDIIHSEHAHTPMIHGSSWFRMNV